MQTETYTTETERYARCVEISKRIRWDIDQAVIRQRKFDFGQKFLPDALSEVESRLERKDAFLVRVMARPKIWIKGADDDIGAVG